MDNRLLLVVAGIGLALIVLGIYLYHLPEVSKYTFVTGNLIGWGDYSYVVVKGDNTRYLYHTDENDNIVLDGPIDVELAHQLDALDNLIAYAEKNGPIGSRQITDEEVDLLTKAGFEVQKEDE